MGAWKLDTPPPNLCCSRHYPHKPNKKKSSDCSQTAQNQSLQGTGVITCFLFWCQFIAILCKTLQHVQRGFLAVRAQWFHSQQSYWGLAAGQGWVWILAPVLQVARGPGCARASPAGPSPGTSIPCWPKRLSGTISDLFSQLVRYVSGAFKIKILKNIILCIDFNVFVVNICYTKY